LKEFWDTLQFYFEDFGLKWMKMMKKRGIENKGIKIEAWDQFVQTRIFFFFF